MLGQPVSMLMPEVVGFRLVGRLPEGATATDLVLSGHRDAPRTRRGRPVRRVLRRWPVAVCHWPTARRSPTWPRNTARPARSSRSTPRRSATWRLWAARPMDRPGRGVRTRAGTLARSTTPTVSGLPRCSSWTSAPSSRRSPDPSDRRIVCRLRSEGDVPHRVGGAAAPQSDDARSRRSRSVPASGTRWCCSHRLQPLAETRCETWWARRRAGGEHSRRRCSTTAGISSTTGTSSSRQLRRARTPGILAGDAHAAGLLAGTPSSAAWASQPWVKTSLAPGRGGDAIILSGWR